MMKFKIKSIFMSSSDNYLFLIKKFFKKPMISQNLKPMIKN